MARKLGVQSEVAGDGTPVFVTVHPSYILRLPNAALQQAERVRVRGDLRVVAAMVRDLGRVQHITLNGP